MNPADIQTLDEAKEYIIGLVSSTKHPGGRCPCCKQKVQAWRKSICSTSAADLMRLVKAYKGQPLHYDSFCTQQKDRNWSQLVLWDLIEPGENTDDSKNSAGTWSPTKLGEEFVWKLAWIPKYITTYDNKIIRKSTELVNIEDALGNKFDYLALIAAQGVA